MGIHQYSVDSSRNLDKLFIGDALTPKLPFMWVYKSAVSSHYIEEHLLILLDILDTMVKL